MIDPWHPVPEPPGLARARNRALARGLSEDEAAVAAELARLGGHDHAFTVVHVGPTTRPQPVIWPMVLWTEWKQ